MKYFGFLLLAIGLESIQGQTLCITTHCFLEMGQCLINPRCFSIITCLQGCIGKPDEAGCAFGCGMTDQNPQFKTLLKCMIKNDCMPKYEDDGICLASDDEALQTITEITQVQGDWWVLKGQNCGQDETWRGGYDWYPCQHGRFIKLENDDWINNTTYCNGHDSHCESDLIVTLPKISVFKPGVIRHDYPEEEAPVAPQVSSDNEDVFKKKRLTLLAFFFTFFLFFLFLSD